MDAFLKRYNLVRIFLYIYIFILPFQRFSSVRDTAFILMLLMFVYNLVKGRTRIVSGDKTVTALLVLFGIIVISSALSPYPVDSFDSIRKNFLYQAVLFFVVLGEFKSMEDMRALFYSLAAGFAVLSVLIVVVNGPHKIINWLTAPDMKYTSGYSLLATFYLPVVIGYVYAAKEREPVKWLLTAAMLFEFILSVFNNHRGQIVAIIAGAAIATLLAKKYRTAALGGAVCVIALLFMVVIKPNIMDRYKTLLHAGNYTSNDMSGWNNRLGIWSGMLDMIEQRPVLGWGYGWKKVSTVVAENGLIEKWKGTKAKTFRYFDRNGHGSASPHNLILQVLFEIGFLGLAALLYFWATVLSKCAGPLFHKGPGDGPEDRFLRCGAIGVLAAYIVINVSNGLWEETSGNLMMVFAAVCVVLHRSIASRNANRDANADCSAHGR